MRIKCWGKGRTGLHELWLITFCIIFFFFHLGQIRLSGAETIVLSLGIFQQPTNQQRVPERQEGKTDKVKPKNDSAQTLKAARSRKAVLEEKQQKVLLLAQNTLTNAEAISSPEYKILVKVEAASLLWQFNPTRANLAFEDSLKEVKELLAAERKKANGGNTRGAAAKLWRAVMNKIAVANPTLLNNMKGEGTLCATCSRDDKSLGAGNINGWTAEAQSLMAVASDQIEMNPQLAAQIAEQGLSFGLVDWSLFLNALSQRDAAEAERLAEILLTELQSSSISVTYLLNQKRFFLESARSSRLQEQYLQAIYFRLQRNLHPMTSAHDLRTSVNVARHMRIAAGTVSLRWMQEFERIALEFERLLQNASLPIPATTPARMIGTASLDGATPGDTQAISDKLSQVSTLVDEKARDNEYQKLAASAAQKADLGLAEHILNKIKNEDIRRDATLAVYGPFVRKSMNEKDWTNAQKYAVQIEEPIGRTLILDRVGQAMLQAGQIALSVEQIYRKAKELLDREEPTIKAAKASVLLAKSLLRLETKEHLKLANSVLLSLNKQVGNDRLYDEPKLTSGISTWVQYRNYYLNEEDILDLPDMLVATFQTMTKMDEENASTVAALLTHPGFRLLAQVGIGKELCQQVKNTQTLLSPKIKSTKP